MISQLPPPEFATSHVTYCALQVLSFLLLVISLIDRCTRPLQPTHTPRESLIICPLLCPVATITPAIIFVRIVKKRKNIEFELRISIPFRRRCRSCAGG